MEERDKKSVDNPNAPTWGLIDGGGCSTEVNLGFCIAKANWHRLHLLRNLADKALEGICRTPFMDNSTRKDALGPRDSHSRRT
jgi:hypothetical protein